MDHLGQFLYVDYGVEPNGTIAYQIGPTTGGLIPVPGTQVAEMPYSLLVVHPTGKWVVVPIKALHPCWATEWDLASGVVTPVSGSPLSLMGKYGIKENLAVCMHPTIRFLYVTRTKSNKVSS
ncbi:hypothetical protein BCY86_03375 [Pajaroellobacter abortibovis]|uniref:Uncharacterized protein n=1 Tax=Pajaroellobacter abortibovis TaxID=1882918 RepID=A0A1L6MWI9_9BACT|nr:hypothetical protein BCY86_03375 [Pajaroellobacter abortibovis]